MARLRSILHPLRRFAQVDAARRARVAEAVLLLALARAALLVVPFPRLARAFGTFTTPGAVRAASPLPNDRRIAQQVGWAVTRAARYLPFRAVCLPQAMAARVMLKRRGVASVMHFGAARDDSRMLATHAWLDAAGVEVTGFPVAHDFTEIACFV